ncbi:MAG TPA: hypothetical protein PK668_21430 [Myxococcota bacterium]|nr:hypothetical protein [Myxococcota bacterium]HRY96039.1 hypothetical protein [Myxococcota bacterium]HSA21431.1 hypothetical protein [Myxococcota bacterium]
MPTAPVTPAALETELLGYVDFFTEVVETRGDPLEAAEELGELSRHYRALGICRLSADADADGFFHYLIQSALTRRFYLQAAQAAGGGDPRHRRASLLEPVLDALAARQWSLARELFELASAEWTQGEEYEDDFCYAAFVRRSLLEPRDDLVTLLARWERVLEGAPDPRLEVARSFVGRAPEAVAAALRSLLVTEGEKARAMADPEAGSVLAEELPFLPNRWVSVEALALLALAERRRIDVQGSFPACPPLARAGVFGAFQSRGFPHVSYTHE